MAAGKRRARSSALAERFPSQVSHATGNEFRGLVNIAVSAYASPLGLRQDFTPRTRVSNMQSERPIVIAGGGPVGVVTALALARQGFEVRLFEAEARVNDSPRAATTHAATLEILENLGLVEEVTRRGLIEPKFRIWDRACLLYTSDAADE